MIQRIEVEVIPHRSQRYETVGDWYLGTGALSGTLYVKVSRMGNWISEMAVAIHEQWEAMACLAAGIPEPVCMAWDIEYEKRRLPGDDSEPGDAPGCPYGPQHKAATKKEREFVESHGMTWADHEARVNRL